MKNKTLFDPSRLLLLLIALIGVGIVVVVFLQVRTDRVKNVLENNQNFVMLVTVAQDEKPLFNEVLMYNPTSKKTAMIDIPPEIGSLIGSLGKVDGIASIFRAHDMKEYLTKLEEFLGMPVPFYVILDAKEIERQVDLLSGIELFVPTPVEETKIDPVVLIPSGNIVLDGAKARDYLLYSDEGEDTADRINRHQKFVQSWLRKIGESHNFLLRDEVFPILYQGLKNNLEDVGVKSFVQLASNADWERIVFQRVLGTVRTVDQSKLLFPHYNGALLKEIVRQVLEGLATKDTDKPALATVTIDILNGTKLSGLASRTSQLLKSFGYEVLSAKNAENALQETTTIIDRRGNPDQAKKIADIIRGKKIITQNAEDNETGADITLILGKDFDGRYVR